MTPIHRNWRVTTTTTTTDQHDPQTGDYIGTTEVLGGVVQDDDRGVTYRVTLGRRRLTEGNPERGSITDRNPVEASGPPVFLAALTIEPHDGAPVDQAALRRVPVQRLAEVVATQHAREAVAWAYDDDEPSGRPHLRGDVPTSEQIEAMLWDGETRHTIAARYIRSPSTVSDWIGRAYRERPNTMPPRRKGGRTATSQTPDDNRRPDRPNK